jgi:hypothetical protein
MMLMMMTTDQSHGAYAPHAAPATVPVMLHFVRGNPPTQVGANQGQNSAEP